MSEDQITLRIVQHGETTATVDRAEYEQAKADGTVDHLTDHAVSDMEVDVTILEPGQRPEIVTITTTEYVRLVAADLTLSRLQRAGVDNWEGYSYIDWDVHDAEVAAASSAAGLGEVRR